MRAYDYDKQEWMTGEAARQLLIQQATEEIRLLSGPKGKEYAEWKGLSWNEAWHGAQDQLHYAKTAEVL